MPKKMPKTLQEYLKNAVAEQLTPYVNQYRFVNNKAYYGNQQDSDEELMNELIEADDSLVGLHISSRYTNDPVRDEELFMLLDESAAAIEEGRRVVQATSIKYNKDNSFARWETVDAEGNLTINHDYFKQGTMMRFFASEDGEKEFAHIASTEGYDDKSSQRFERKLRRLRVADNMKENAKTFLGFCMKEVFGLKENAIEMLGLEKRSKGECAADRIRLLSRRYTPLDK